jgi:DNA-binding transcriptional ArsR family regulator
MESLGCVSAFRALGEETRLRMLRMLLDRQMSVNEIAAELDASQYNVSRHLKVLREAGLLEIEKSGQQRLYRVPKELQRKISKAGARVLDLGCCTFQLDKPLHSISLK